MFEISANKMYLNDFPQTNSLWIVCDETSKTEIELCNKYKYI